MISFCMLNEVFTPLFNDPFESAIYSGLPNPRDFKDPQSFRAALLAHRNLLNDTYAQVRGAENRQTGPGDSFWSHIPFSNESEAKSQLDQIDSDLRKLDTDPKYFNAWSHGGDAPSWFAHPVDNSINFINDHPVISGLGAATAAYGLYKAKQHYDKKKQEKQMSQGLSGFSRDY